MTESLDTLFKVVTTEGITVSNGPSGGGFGAKLAERECEKRNRAAEQLGIKTRYEAVGFGAKS